MPPSKDPEVLWMLGSALAVAGQLGVPFSLILAVFFAGYQSRLREPERFGFGRLSRESDGFFVKLSYLFRM